MCVGGGERFLLYFKTNPLTVSWSFYFIFYIVVCFLLVHSKNTDGWTTYTAMKKKKQLKTWRENITISNAQVLRMEQPSLDVKLGMFLLSSLFSVLTVKQSRTVKPLSLCHISQRPVCLVTPVHYMVYVFELAHTFLLNSPSANMPSSANHGWHHGKELGFSYWCKN